MTATRFLSASAIAVTLCTSFAFTAEPANPASAEMLGQRIAKIRKQAHAAELRLRRQTIDQSAPPKNDIVSISCENGSMFEKRADGCFVASGPNPEHEVITLTLEPAKAGRVVRIDFPLDESLPGKGPGRTRNGNFAISEIEVDGGHAIAAWASASEAPCHPWLMLDRIIGKYGNSWNADAHRHDPRTLLLTLLKPTPAGKKLKIRLVCKSHWGEHVPGCISAAVLPDPELAGDVVTVSQAERDVVLLDKRRLFALARSLTETSPGATPTSGPALREGDKIVALGDSITAAGGQLRLMDSVIAQQLPHLKIPKIINKGIGGQKAEDLLRRFDRDVVQQRPAFVTIKIGINDVWHRLRSPHDPNVLATYKRNLSAMVDAAQRSGIRVLLLTPTVIRENPSSEGNRRLAKYVAAVKEVAAEKRCGLVDLHGLFLAAINTKSEVLDRGWLTSDGVHMNPLGDMLMAAATLRAIGVSPDQLEIDRPAPSNIDSQLVRNLREGRKQTIVAYGTSLTSGGAWVKQLDAALEARFSGQVDVINSGAGGMWSTWGVENLDRRVIEKKPDTVIIEFAINDAYLPYKTSVAEARANLENMIHRARASLPETEIVLMTMNPPIGNHLERRPDIQRYYEMYRQVARQEGLKLIDHARHWDRVYEHNRNVFHRYVPDGIHPAAEGCGDITTTTLLSCLGAPPSDAPDKIKVLLVGGRGSHDFSGFYDILRPLLEKAGDFVLDMTLEIDTLRASYIEHYDVVLFYGPGGEFTDPAQERGLHEFVKKGGGLVGVHATDAFKESDVYWRLLGGRFTTHRGGEFTIRIMDSKHPVMAPFKDFRIHDETYQNEYHPDFELHSLFRMDRGQEQQSMGWVQSYGEGRVFNTTLGHDGKAWKSEDFQAIVRRGIYWAADREPK